MNAVQLNPKWPLDMKIMREWMGDWCEHWEPLTQTKGMSPEPTLIRKNKKVKCACVRDTGSGHYNTLALNEIKEITNNFLLLKRHLLMRHGNTVRVYGWMLHPPKLNPRPSSAFFDFPPDLLFRNQWGRSHDTSKLLISLLIPCWRKLSAYFRQLKKASHSYDFQQWNGINILSHATKQDDRTQIHILIFYHFLPPENRINNEPFSCTHLTPFNLLIY